MHDYIPLLGFDFELLEVGETINFLEKSIAELKSHITIQKSEYALGKKGLYKIFIEFFNKTFNKDIYVTGNFQDDLSTIVEYIILYLRIKFNKKITISSGLLKNNVYSKVFDNLKNEEGISISYPHAENNEKANQTEHEKYLATIISTEMREYLIGIVMFKIKNSSNIFNKRATAEDLVQDAILKGINKHKTLAPQSNIKAWMARITINLLVDSLRREKRKPIVRESNDKDAWSELKIQKSSYTISSIFDTNQELDLLLKKAINKLPDEQRDVIVLRMYAEMSFKEISNLQQISINTALGRMRYALINLRKDPTINQELINTYFSSIE